MNMAECIQVRLWILSKLLGKPFAEPLLNLFLRNCSLAVSDIQAVAHLLNDVKVILNVL